MNSYYDPHDENIGPFDVDPNQSSRSNAKSRTPSLFPMTPEQFHTIRADFVANLKEWRSGSSGKTTANMAEILEYMVDDFDHFKTAIIPNQTSTCFARKCDLIKHEVLQLIQRLKSSPELGLETEEIMAYIGSAIRRLSIEGESDIDAVDETYKFAKIHEQHVWDMPELGFTKDAEGLRTRLWTVYTNVNFSRAGCGCYQCGMYWRG